MFTCCRVGTGQCLPYGRGPRVHVHSYHVVRWAPDHSYHVVGWAQDNGSKKYLPSSQHNGNCRKMLHAPFSSVTANVETMNKFRFFVAIRY